MRAREVALATSVNKLAVKIADLQEALVDAKVSLDPAGETQWYKRYKPLIKEAVEETS